MLVMSACKLVMLDYSWVMTVHSGSVCMGFVPATMESQAVVTKPDYSQDCSRYLAEKILLHRESFRCP